MTEEEWLASCDMLSLIPFLRGKGTDRKFRLFVCACGRRAWEFIGGPLRQQALEVAERLADGAAGGQEGAAMRQALLDVFLQPAPPPWTHAHDAASAALEEVAFEGAERAAVIAPDEGWQATFRAQSHLLRCIFGNPFRPVSLNPACRTPAVSSLAEAAYENRTLPSGELEPARLAILADALEEAGCAEAAILDHLRGPGPHVRGCWVVDRLLGKE
jgi:hypothetical protein